MLVTSAGSGSSMLGELALTGWTGDPVEDAEGLFVYLRDPLSGAAWSLGHRPMRRAAGLYETAWRPGCFEILRAEDGLEVRLEICVPPDATCEIRRLTFVNRSSRARRLEVTTFADVVLAEPAAHAAHPVFSKLFVQTAWDAAQSAILAHRRPRAAGETGPWLVHAPLCTVATEFETDRGRFLGRGRRAQAPRAIDARRPLSGTAGNVLDPAVSLRWSVELPPESRVQHGFLLGTGSDRDAALALVRRFAGAGAMQTAFDAARRSVESALARFEIAPRVAERFEALAGAMLYGAPELRARAELLEQEASPWKPLPAALPANRGLAVLHAESAMDEALLAGALTMHRWWRHLALPLELVVVTAGELPAALAGMDPAARPVVLSAADLDPDARRQLDAVARYVIGGPWARPQPAEGFGTLGRLTLEPVAAAGAATAHPHDRAAHDATDSVAVGGFSADGRAYALQLARGADGSLPLPPQPWVNVVANERCGFLVSETGAGTTWCGNSREHRLTPWSNDPVTDPHGEAFYIRDEETGRFWSLFPGPATGTGTYDLQHTIGTTRCTYAEDAIRSSIELFVPVADPVRIARVRIRNEGRKARRLSIFAYARLVLGGRPEDSGRFVVTRIDAEARSVWAHNPASETRSAAFSMVAGAVAGMSVSATADRASFQGQEADLAHPAALRAPRLDGRAGAGLDPCAAHQVTLDLAAGAGVELAFVLGEGRDASEAGALVEHYRSVGAVDVAQTAMHDAWSALLDAVQVRTPSRALDLMMNAWLPYQVLSCRVWGRTAFYQSGGAFGFRDQLQDAAALVYAKPEHLRAQLLLHAAHQFEAGDVLHWWHPPQGRGLRTRFVDDLLWLPYLTAFYVATTGDSDILRQRQPFVRARMLRPGEDEAYLQTVPGEPEADLYEHCCRAIDRSLAVGAHDLPLFGTGNWNDGMNRVGREGRGESVWMGFFLDAVLGDFLPLCTQRGDAARAQRYAAHREKLRDALEASGWDGAWYRRGYYDDGTPLGTHSGDECRIDALVQAWAVLSRAAPRPRAEQALDAVERHLVSEPDGIVRLLWPPFDRTPHDPGYIKGYVPGVRENGGQYTHAALWVVRALAELGRNDRAARLLEMLSPVTHTADPDRVATYRVEPYVVAADVYSTPPHVGRGGWTWYTGSAGWMLRVLLESILGMRLENGTVLRLEPCVPDDWPAFTIEYTLPANGTRYTIEATNPHRSGRGVRAARHDGQPLSPQHGVARIPLARDGGSHRVDLVLGDGAGQGA